MRAISGTFKRQKRMQVVRFRDPQPSAESSSGGGMTYMKTNSFLGARVLGAAVFAIATLVACASDVTVGSGSGALGGLGEAPKGDGTCDVRLDPCGGVCVALSGDTNNCGACGNACGAGQTCSNGACASPLPPPPDAGPAVDSGNCDFGFDKCGAGGACVEILFDNKNCGTCGNICGAGTTCTRGNCL